MAPHTVFRSASLAARAYLERGSSLCFVVFDPMVDDFSLDRHAFGEAFLDSRGYDAIHILSAHNNWFQDPDLPAVLDRVRELTRPYERVVYYGSSMGGYAALRYAGRGGAHVAIAISPQYSAQSDLTFDPRWIGLRSKLQWLHEARGEPLDPVPEAVIIYDDRDHDRHHAALIIRDLPHVQQIAIAYAGHPAGAVLLELGLLTSTVLDAAHGRLDVLALRAEIRRRRRASGQYLFTLARKQPQWRMRTKRALALLATEAEPSEPVYLSYAALVLETTGDTNEAMAFHARATATHSFLLAELRRARSLWRAGRADEARLAIDQARSMRSDRATPIDIAILDLAILMRALDNAPRDALAMLAGHPRWAGKPAIARCLHRLGTFLPQRSRVLALIGRRVASHFAKRTMLEPANLRTELAFADMT